MILQFIYQNKYLTTVSDESTSVNVNKNEVKKVSRRNQAYLELRIIN